MVNMPAAVRWASPGGLTTDGSAMMTANVIAEAKPITAADTTSATRRTSCALENKGAVGGWMRRDVRKGERQLAPHAEANDAGRAGAADGAAFHHRRAAATADCRHEAFVGGAAGGLAGRIERAQVCHGAWRPGWSRRPRRPGFALGPGHPARPGVACWAGWSCCAGFAFGPGHPARPGITNRASRAGRSDRPGFALFAFLTLGAIRS